MARWADVVQEWKTSLLFMYALVCVYVYTCVFILQRDEKKKDINTDEREIEEERGYPASTAKKKKNKFG